MNPFASARSTFMANLTTTGAEANGFITAYPCAEGRPQSSSAQFAAGRSNATFVFVRTDDNGEVCLYNSRAVHMIVDKVLVTPIMAIHNAQRKIDTRQRQFGATKLRAGAVQRVNSGVPGKTAVGTLTVVSPEAGGFATAFPCNSALPDTSTMNFRAGQTVANTAGVKADATGAICVYTSATAHILWDQVSETITMPAAGPKRIHDTRFAGGPPVRAGATTYFFAPAASTTTFGNLTITAASGDGYATVYPCAEGRPDASSINFRARETVANYVAVKSDNEGKVCVYTTQNAHVIWDQAATSTMYRVANAVRVADTRN